jgi:D-beta-D-heptose 7-phosphate kinase/D-beta-D-heptose 1-phosphate adenosyltransferase
LKKFVLVSGGFDPLHQGHLAYLEAAYRLGDGLIVGLNSDAWLTRKKGKGLLTWDDRAAVLNALWMVDEVWAFDDADGSASDFIRKVIEQFPDCRFVFANGGDRDGSNIPEMSVDDYRLDFAFGVGGSNKINSSSDILGDYVAYHREQFCQVIQDEVDGWVRQPSFSYPKALTALIEKVKENK